MSAQRSHPSGKVVSVRLPDDLIKLLDSLAERTGRSRGFYIREALLEAFPKMEERYWAHSISEDERQEKEAYTAILQGLHNDTQSNPGDLKS